MTGRIAPAADGGQGALVLPTTLLGPLRVPGGAGRTEDIAALSAQAAL
jgi:hypothetical protein